MSLSFLKGKNFLDHSMKYENDNKVWLRQRYHWLGIYSPGNTGREGTTSLQTFDGKWLVEESELINVRYYEHSYEFKEASTYWSRPNLFNTGFLSLESSKNSGYYIRHGGFRLKMQKNDGSTIFHNDASWLVRESGNPCIFVNVTFI